MRIANPREYVTDRAKITEDAYSKAVDAGKWYWQMKRYTDNDGNNLVTLYHLDAGCYFDVNQAVTFAKKAKKECWLVEYQLGTIGAAAYFTDEVEAINFTLKIIELIKA